MHQRGWAPRMFGDQPQSMACVCWGRSEGSRGILQKGKTDKPPDTTEVMERRFRQWAECSESNLWEVQIAKQLEGR